MFTGSMVAMITPFKGGKVDWQSLETLIDFHIQSGTHGIVPCGTTGESATLSHQEHDEIIKAVIKAVNRRLPVIAGTGSNSTDEAVRLTREAEKSGADGALMISPYYNRPTQEGIYQHYKKVASEVGIPIIVYNIPGRTGSKIEPETLARLAEIKNIAGVKEATGSVDQAIDVIRLCGDNLAVYSGEDTLTFSLMGLGGKGVISTVANVAPREMSQLTEACLAREWERGRDLQLKLTPLIRSLFIETNPIPVKTAASLMGKCTSELRLPLTPMAEGNLKKLKQAMVEFGLIKQPEHAG
jgi:4-hydroxy-tetrahydrodipicolinate synthase